jgi:solute carrier family 25 S-adenosylmethionine transporter 26
MRDILQDCGVSDSAAVLAASLVNAVPSSIVAVPADVVKKQMLLSSSTSSSASIKEMAGVKPVVSVQSIASTVYRQHGIRGFFLGWQANMLKDIPFAAIKMSLYESIARLYLRYVVFPSRDEGRTRASDNMETERDSDASQHNTHEHLNSDMLNKRDAAIVGFISGAITAVLTNPLDCANTRIKSGELSQFTLVQAHREIVRKDGPLALFRGLLPRTVIIGFGSTVFWFFYAIASGNDKQHH